MHAHVAVRAVLISRIHHIVGLRKPRDTGSRAPKIASAVVAFEAKCKDNWPPQKPRIRRAVGVMAHLAPFHAHWWMFKRKGPALIGMAFQTSFFVSDCLVHERRTSCHAPCRSEGAMWIMAVATGHEAFINPMLKWHRELRPEIAMAAVT
jgi:hypothetical protein